MASQLFTRTTSSSYEIQMRRSRLRRILLETLERRELLAADSAGVMFAPGTPQDYMNAIIQQYRQGTAAETSGEGSANFVAPGARWSNPVGGVSASQGDSATVTWSIVPDGTVDADRGGTSNLIAFMDSIYGGGSGPVSQRPWFNIIEKAYDRWSEVSGLKFVYEAADDGAPMANAANRGIAGVRGDARIGGHSIDGDFGVLGYNYFPNSGGNQGFDGDMILDTNDIFYFNNADGPTGENRGLFNVLMHEGGHGLGLDHVSPIDQTKLMEPTLTLAFLGAQHDDILGAQKLYGDPLEENDTRATATDLGELPIIKLTTNSINKVGDDDWFRFTVPSPQPLSVLLQPIGQQYLVGPDGGTPVAVNTLRNQDLSFQLLAANGTTVLTTVNATGVGGTEQLPTFNLPAAGTYYLKIVGAGAATANPQLYDLTIRTQDLGTGPRLLSVAPNSGDIFTFNNTNLLSVAPTELVFRFDGASDLDFATVKNGIRVIRAGANGQFDPTDEIVPVGYVGQGDNNRIVILRFATTLADDLYRVEINGEDVPALGITAIKNNAKLKLATRAIDSTPADKTKDTVDFKLELGALVQAVVPQPVDRAANGTLTPKLDVIRVYFNNDNLYSAPVVTGAVTPNPTVVDPAFYQLILTQDTARPNDDSVFRPISISYDPTADMAELTFASNIDQLAGGAGTFRLRVGQRDDVVSLTNPQSLTPISPADPSSTTGTALDLNSGAAISGAFTKLVNQDIGTTDGSLLPLQYPGSNYEPGHRDIQDENHLAASADSNPSITTAFYNFSIGRSYGVNASNQPVFTTITPEQQQRVREIFEFYSAQSGIDFVESVDQGMRIVVGDLYPNGSVSGPGGTLGVASTNNLNGLAIMDGAENWNNSFGGDFMITTMHEIGHMLGLGHTTDLPEGTFMTGFGPGFPLDLAFPGDHDVAHLQYIYRPDNRDVDLYRFEIAAGVNGTLKAETTAERLANSSNLDSQLTLFRQTASGKLEVVAANDNYFGEDSFLQVNLGAGIYFLGVTSTGNEDYNPVTGNNGSGGTSQGQYQLRFNFEPAVQSSIVDLAGTALDGDGDGLAGGNFDFWFRAATPAGAAAVGAPKTIYVDKGYTGPQTGSPTQPMNNLDITNTLKWPAGFLQPGDVIRVVGSVGADLNLSTTNDNAAYEIGRFGVNNTDLSDGISIDVPQGVTMMIDAGAIFKMRGSRIVAGSRDASIDNHLSSVQVLGTPQQSVIFTSYDDESLGIDTNSLTTTPQPGNWGGIEFHNDIDRNEGRADYERLGIFLNYVANADMRYGGGLITVTTPSPSINPIHLSDARPTLINNRIRLSSDSAISADPNSFEETLFTETRYQTAQFFQPDYERVGPDIRGNTLLQNSINGLFVRVPTLAGNQLQTLDVAARFDDKDITHVLGQNLIIAGTPGGSFRESVAPDLSLVQLQPASGGLTTGATFTYKVTFFDRRGAESIPSAATALATVGAGGAIKLTNLPDATNDFVGRRVWRSAVGGAGPYTLVAELDAGTPDFIDAGGNLGATLASPNATSLQRARPDASLTIDAGIIIKSLGSRIEVGMGAQLLAEGTPENRVVFTSRYDDRYGAGGTFDTNNDGTANTPRPGDWGGLLARQLSSISVDSALVTYAGGVTAVPGGFGGFNAIEIHQADGRVVNSIFENNANGLGGSLATRDGRGTHDASIIFVRAAQPVIMDNIFRDNQAAVVSVDANAMKAVPVQDLGRQTGGNDRDLSALGNMGPLVRGNRLSGNTLNGMVVRGATLTTETAWDDTDIVHILQTEIVAPNFHTFGGLRLQSRVDESLVVKLNGNNAGITASGTTLDITDRLGGSVQVIGTPGFPVVMTSISDDSVGAGFDPTGAALVDTNNNGLSTGVVGGWRSVLMNKDSNDRNLDTVPEYETDQIQDVGVNDTAQNAQSLGGLADNLNGGDENLRLGFTVHGVVASVSDTDVYSFTGTAGTPVWIDIDRTDAALDSVVELIDSTGRIIAISDNSLRESAAGAVTYINTALIAPDKIQTMESNAFAPQNPRQAGSAVDFQSVNPADAGFRAVLPGTAGAQNTYYVRVRSSNVAPGQSSTRLQDLNLVSAGLTTGAYRLQIRMQQDDEIAGSTIRYADIRFAQTGVDVSGLPAHSPLLGSSSERSPQQSNPLNAVDLGNLASSDRGAFSLAGEIAAADNEVDFYQFSIHRTLAQTVGQHISTTFDIDYASDYGRPNTSLWVYQKVTGGYRLVLTGSDSNIADDRARPGQLLGDQDDLSRGSSGSKDAYIGSQELPDGDYIVAVSNNSQLAVEYRQFQEANPASPLVRIEPIDSIQRIVTDRFENPLGNQAETFLAPKQVAFNGPNLASTNSVPFTLADVSTFVVQDFNTGSRLLFANAMTGAKEAEGVQIARVNDVAMSSDGRLVAYTIPTTGTTNTDAVNGNFVLIDPAANGATTALGNSGIQTFTTEQTAAGPPPTFAIRQRTRGGAQVGDGMQFHALTFYTNANAAQPTAADLRLFGVGRRSPGNENFNRANVAADGTVTLQRLVDDEPTNIIYRLDPLTGAALQPANGALVTARNNNRTLGAGTDIVEFGTFVTADRNSIITGVADLGNRLVAVSDAGELFVTGNIGDGTNVFGNINPLPTKIIDPATSSAVAFSGLAPGPANLEGGRYANLLFGTTAAGVIYAFNQAGVLQNVFPGGNYKISASGTDSLTNGAGGNVKGIDFSPLDVNLWHQTNTQSAVAGHGRNSTFDLSRQANQPGTNSLYFGFENSANDTTTSRQPGSWDPVHSVFDGGYNLPGGAQGAIESLPVDLRGYSAEDLPTLYFTYYLDTENANSDSADTNVRMKDALRVYIAGDDGRWIEVVTNNSAKNGNFSNARDEFDANISGYADPYGLPLMVQEAYDVGDGGAPDSWRQAKINLAPFAGQKNVKIRYEFSTGATFRTGDPERGGVELNAVEGSRLADGNTFSITADSDVGGGTKTFEFDLGLVLNLPGGSSILPGSQLDMNGNVFTFSTTTNGANDIFYSLAATPAQIATAVSNKLTGAGFTVVTNSIRSNVINVTNAPVGTYALVGLPAATIEGRPGLLNGTAVRVPVNQSMTTTQVRDAIRTELAAAFNVVGRETDTSVWPVYGDSTIRMFKYTVASAGPLSTAARSGDGFGVQLTGTAPNGGGAYSTMSERAQNNAGNVGVFIDDIVIGLAERGEMVTNTVASTGASSALFTTNLQYEQPGLGFNGSTPDEIERGRYQLEIRASAEYGVQSGANLDLDGVPPFGPFSRSFDSNDRFAQQIGIQVTGSIADGSTFTLSDGVGLVTFEFDVTNVAGDIAAGTASGNIPIAINANDTTAQVANKIRDAINRTTVQSLLKVSASVNGELSSTSTNSGSSLVLLHGPAALSRTGGLTFTGINGLSIRRWGTESTLGEDMGDTNRSRDQGLVVISSSTVSDSQNFGINVDAAPRTAIVPPSTAVAPTFPGAAINFPTDNADRLAPGVVIFNNILAENRAGGISISGEPTTEVQHPVTIARVLNNTIYGTKNGDVGIRVNEDADPLILNNVIAHTSTAITVAGANPNRVIGGTLYFDNASQIALPGESVRLVSTTSPFVNAASGFFYPSADSLAIDSSLEVSEELDSLKQIKGSLQLPLSPAIAPDRDFTGQRRVDDFNVAPPGGVGANAFKDRGAVERADVTNLTAVLLQPQDNDSANVDVDRNSTYVRLTAGRLDFFSILLNDGDGVGPDETTVQADRVTITENGRLLKPGVDYIFGYNANSRTIRLTPLAGIWRTDSVYEITLNNQKSFDLTVGNGNAVADGDKFTVAHAGGTSVFELDSNGTAATPGAKLIPFTTGMTNYQIALQLRTAINSAGIGVSAVTKGDGTITILSAISVVAAGGTGVSATTLPAIADLAGNPLFANRPNSLTQFTIVMPDAGFDFGDAQGTAIPVLLAANSSVAPVVSNGNGARHVVLPIDVPLLALGTLVDTDSNGQPTAAADGDDADTATQVLLGTLGSVGGITLGKAGPATLSVPAGAGLSGQTFVITDTAQRPFAPVTFEFTTNAVAGGIVIPVVAGDNANQVAIKVATAVNSAVLSGRLTDLTAVAIGSQVSLGGTTSQLVDLSGAAGVSRLLTGSVEVVVPTSVTALADGQTMTVQDGSGHTVIFELNNTDPAVIATPVAAGRVAINVNLATANAASVATAIADAINGQVAARNLSLSIASVGNLTATGVSVLINGDDEDGVSFGGLFNAGSAPVPISVVSTGAGLLDAWIDWNHDGDFNDAGEKLFGTSQPVHTGVNVFEVQTPANATIGFTTSRFRLSTLGGLLPSGVGIGGEVEDHLIEIVAGAPPVGVTETYAVDEDAVLTVTSATPGVLANDTDANLSTIIPGVNIFVFDQNPSTTAIEPRTTTANGTLVLNLDGTFTYTPNLDFHGTDRFVYFATDGRLRSNLPTTVTINVNPVNDAPLGVDDTIGATEDQLLVQPGSVFTANDLKHNRSVITNEDTQVITLIGASIVSAQTSNFGVNGLGVRFASQPGQGAYGIRVNVTSQDLGLNVAPTVTVAADTVNVVLNSHAASPTTVNQLITAVNANAASLVVASLDSGVGTTTIGDKATAYSPIAVPPRAGSAAVDPTTHVLTYTPPANYNSKIGGPAILRLTIQDDATEGGPALTSTSLLTINIAERNDNPEFTLPPTTSTTEDAGLVTVNGFLTGRRPGPALATDEATGPAIATENQQVTYTVRALDPSLFVTLPTITPSTDAAPGTLSYQLKPDLNKITPFPRILVEVIATDNGSAGNVLINRFDASNMFPSLPNVYDGAKFTVVDTNGNTVVFELNDAVNLNGVGSTAGVPHAPIQYVAGDTLQTLNAKIVAAINSPPAASIKPGTGAWRASAFADLVSNEIKFSGEASVTVAAAARVVALDNLLTTPLAAGTTIDGATFTLADADGDWITFEFNDTANVAPATTGVAATRVAINYDSTTTTRDQLSAAIVQAINNPPANFAARWTASATLPAGSNRLQLANVSDITLSASTATIINPLAAKTIEPAFGKRAANTSVPRTFTIVPEAVNDAPEFTLGPAPRSLEDQGRIIVPGFMTGIRKGPATALDEVVQTLNIAIAANPASFSEYPTISLTTGDLTYQTAPQVNDATGHSFVVVVTVSDNGGTTPGVNTTVKTFTIGVTPRNDAPEFTMPPSTPTVEDAGLVTVSNFLTNRRPGDVLAVDEATGPATTVENQQVTYTVRALDPTLFVTQPTITPSTDAAPGTLTYQLKPDLNQVTPFPRILVEVVAVDTGAGGNVLSNRFDPSNIFPAVPNVYDGAKVTITDTNGNVVVFELNDSVNLPSVGSTGGFAHVPVNYLATDTAASLSSKLVAAFNNPPAASVKPGAGGAWAVKSYVDAVSGEIKFTGDASVATAVAAPVTVIDNLFPALAAGTSFDRATFTVTDRDGDWITFEFNDTSNTSPATAGVAADHVAINYDSNTVTKNQLSQAISTAINTVPARFAARWNVVSTLPAGTDRLQLSGVSAISLSASTATIINPLAAKSLLPVFAQRNTNESVPRTFTILPEFVNDAPEFTLGANPTSLEDQGITVVPGFVSGIRKGPATALDETVQTLSYTVSYDANAFTATGFPKIDLATGNLTYETARNVNQFTGQSFVVGLTIMDNGGTLRSGVDKTTKSFTIVVSERNDAPEFTLPPSTSIFQEDPSAPVIVPDFVTGIQTGPLAATDEGAGRENQNVTFTVTALNPGLFSQLPTITAGADPTKANLNYRLAMDVNQIVPFPTILVEVVAVDTGAGGNVLINRFDPTRTFPATPNIYDGAKVTVVDANGNTATFELEDSVNLPGVGNTGGFAHVAIPYSSADTPTTLGQKIAAAISNPPAASIKPGVPAAPWIAKAYVDAFSNEIRFTGETSVTSNSPAPVTLLTNLATLPLAAGSTFDGASFTLTDIDGDSITYEFNDTTNTAPATAGVAPGRVAINYNPSFTKNQLSQAIHTAINTPPASVAARWNVVSTLPAGSDRLQLSGVINTTISVSTTTVINPLLAESLQSVFAKRDANKSAPRTFTILPNPINDAPEFTLTQSVISVKEDAGLQTIPDFVTGARPGPATALDELQLQTMTMTVAARTPSSFTATGQPKIVLDSATGKGILTFETNADVNNLTDLTGYDLEVIVTLKDNGGVFNPGDVDTTVKTFTLSVAPINDAPSFALPTTSLTFFEDQEQVDGTTQTVVNGFATNVVAGPVTAVDETVLGTQQTVSFTIVSVSNPGLFATQPTLTWTGSTTKTADLKFKTKPHQNGQSEVVVRLIDTGANATTGNGDVNQSVTDKTFTINLTPVNDPPEFSNTINARSIEDQGLVIVPGFLADLRPGPMEATDEAAQVLTIHAVPRVPTAFSTFSIAVDGTLTYRTRPDVNRLNTDLSFTVYLTDNGTAGPAPDNNRSATATYSIDVEPINDRPTFTLNSTQVDVIEDVEQFQGTTETRLAGFATNLQRGPLTATDEINQVLTFQIVSVSAPELFSVQPLLNPVTGDLTFTTAQHKNGKSVVVARLVDDGLGSPSPNDRNSILQTFTIAIAPINDPPQFNMPATITVDEDAGLVSRSGFATGVRRGPVGSDDENSQLVSFKVAAVDPSLFSVQPAIGVDGTLTFQTQANVNSANATLLVKVTLEDNGLNAPAPNINHTAEQTFTIVVNAVNDAPTTDAFTQSVDEDSSVVIQATSVLVGDLPGPTADENGQTLRITQVQRTSLNGGIVTPVFDVLDPTKIISFTYAAPSNLVGEDTFLYVVTDNGSPERSGTGTVTMLINPINDPPQFNRGPDQAIAEDVPKVTVPNWATGIFAGPASATDERASQTVSFFVVADNSALFAVQPAIASDGTLTYTLAKDANGSTRVTLVAIDNGPDTPPNNPLSPPQTFTISISPINDAPVFTPGSNVNVLEDSGLYSQPWATNIAPAAGLLLTPPTATDESAQIVDFEVLVNRPELFSVQPRISSTGILEFAPVGDAFEQAVLVVTAVDRGPASPLDTPRSAPRTFTITIAPSNDAPVANPDRYSTTEDGLLNVSAPGLLANDTDVDLPLDTLTVIGGTITSDLGATVVINANGSLSYDARTVPSFQQLINGQSISDTFVYQIRDASGALSNSATVTITINGVDDAPLAVNDIYSVGVGVARNLDVLANDTDVDSTIDPRSIVIKANPGFGTLSVNQLGFVTYTPESGFRGTDSFSYTVKDTAGNESNVATVTIAVNTAPVASNDSSFTFKGESVDINVLGNDRDIDGTLDPTSVRIEVSPGPDGTAEVLPNGQIRFTPRAGFFGQAKFSYSVKDNTGTPSNVADVNVRVQNSKWQNPQNSLDVNGSGQVSPIDVLEIINYLNAQKNPYLPESGVIPAPYLDPTGDELVTPQDVLAVINYLNSNSQGGQGEGESTAYAMMVTPEQMMGAVGRQVVEEVQSAITQSLSEALHENDSCPAYAPSSAMLGEGESSRDDDELLDLLSLEGNLSSKTVDAAFGQYFGDDLIRKRPR